MRYNLLSFRRGPIWILWMTATRGATPTCIHGFLKTLGLYLTPCQKSKTFPEVPNFHELHPSYKGCHVRSISMKSHMASPI